MRIGIVVDSACDLPQSFIDENKIVILPITLHLDGQTMLDDRNAATTIEFYRKHVTDAARAETSAFTVEQIKKLFLERLVLDYDLVFCFTIASSRSPMFDNANRAALQILNEYKPIRAAAGIPTPFGLRIIDTQNCFGGQAIPVIECVRMIKAGESHNKIRERLEFLTQNTYGYLLPRDLKQLRARAHKKGDKSVGLLQYVLGSALDVKPLVRGYRNTTQPVTRLRHFDEGVAKVFKYVEGQIRKGLLTPSLLVEYGGDPRLLEALPGYAQLVNTAHAHGVEVFVAMMSMVAGIHVGEGAVGVAFAATEHEVDL
ncbi:MAG: DegV family EDD domain-containing protein [Nevskiaceae bacterium]|nr:MAG: DegV family EDD domain-containing protein [Nevskiaceae bacterium]TAM28823.1 MAG: DegV family EDD domain-containing protein [Nevskiaceae bacterium]